MSKSYRFIVETTERQYKPEIYGKYMVNLSTGRAPSVRSGCNRTFHCNSDKAFKQRIEELDNAGVSYSVHFFDSYLSALMYIWETMEYLNDGVKSDPLGFSLKYGYSFK